MTAASSPPPVTRSSRAGCSLRATLAALTCALALCSLNANPVRAQGAGDEAIANGIALRRQGKNAEALREFQRAYAADPSPRALAQIALAQQALGNWLAAESGLVSALSAAHDNWIVHNRAALAGALEIVR